MTIAALSRDALREMYITRNMTDAVIAGEIGCSRAYVTELRSAHGIQRLYRHQRRRLPMLSGPQMEIMIGSLLGDGCIVHNRFKRDAHYEERHCTAQAEYLRWKATEFASLEPYFVSRDRQAGSTHTFVEMRLPTHPQFSELRRLWYPNGRKVLPPNLEQMVTPLGLAVWFMDDGSRCATPTSWSVSLASCGFTAEENQRLKALLFNRFGISMNVNSGGGYLSLRAYSVKAARLLDVVAPHIHPVMAYKLGKASVNTETHSALTFAAV